jgi:hypothetical protein
VEAGISKTMRKKVNTGDRYVRFIFQTSFKMMKQGERLPFGGPAIPGSTTTAGFHCVADSRVRGLSKCIPAELPFKNEQEINAA